MEPIYGERSPVYNWGAVRDDDRRALEDVMYINDEDWRLICDAADRLDKLQQEYNANVDLMFNEMKEWTSEKHGQRQAKVTGMILATIFTLRTSIKYAQTEKV